MDRKINPKMFYLSIVFILAFTGVGARGKEVVSSTEPDDSSYLLNNNSFCYS